MKNQNTIEKSTTIKIRGIMDIEKNEIITIEIDGETMRLSELLADINNKYVELVITSNEVNN